MMQAHGIAGTQDGARDGNEPRPGIVRVPGWEQYPWLRAGFSTRQGGRSAAYGAGEQNLGWTLEDDPAAVALNRSAFAAAVSGGEDAFMVTSRQVHGRGIRVLEREAAPWMAADGKALHEGDGMVTNTPGQLLAVLTADCVPVLVADTRLRAVGAFHAGWRGTLLRIVEGGIEQMAEHYGSRAEDLVAAIGPCIHACCFEVGEEVRRAFTQDDAEAERLFQTSNDGGNPYMDLPRANQLQLLHAGLRPANVLLVAQCTACSRTSSGHRAFFSHRAEQGRTGRMLSGIAVVAP